jgi:hypothetical protein
MSTLHADAGGASTVEARKGHGPEGGGGAPALRFIVKYYVNLHQALTLGCKDYVVTFYRCRWEGDDPMHYVHQDVFSERSIIPLEECRWTEMKLKLKWASQPKCGAEACKMGYVVSRTCLGSIFSLAGEQGNSCIRTGHKSRKTLVARSAELTKLLRQRMETNNIKQSSCMVWIIVLRKLSSFPIPIR